MQRLDWTWLWIPLASPASLKTGVREGDLFLRLPTPLPDASPAEADILVLWGFDMVIAIRLCWQ
jgi:hypothetical protein